MVNGRICEKMMKFQKMPLHLLPMSQNMGEILEISQNATRQYELPYPMREIDEILIMAKVFANTLALYLAFLENFPNILTCSGQY